MIEIENIEDFDFYGSPTITRKTSDCLAQTNMTQDSIEYCSGFQLNYAK
jgi:hypothetical protein